MRHHAHSLSHHPHVTGRGHALASHSFLRLVLLLLLLPLAGTTPAAQPQPDTLRVAGHLGGWVGCAAIDGGFAVVGRGGAVSVMDISGPLAVQLGWLPLPSDHEARLTAIQGTLACVISTADSLYVIDIADPTSPAVLGVRKIPGISVAPTITRMVLRDSTLLLACEQNGVRIVDLHAPAAPTIVHQSALVSRDCAVSGTHAFHIVLEGGAWKFVVQDIANPSSPVELARIALTGTARRLTLAGPTAWVSMASGIIPVDVSNPAAPIAGPVVNTGRQFDIGTTSSTHLFLRANRLSGSGQSILAFDIAAPLTPVLAGQIDLSTSVYSIDHRNGMLHIATGAGFDRVDVSTASQPALAPRAPNPSRPNGITAGGTSLIVTDPAGIHRYDATTAAAPTPTHLWSQYRDWIRPAVDGTTLLGIDRPANTVKIVDVSNPDAPALRGSFTPMNGTAMELTVHGTLAFVGCSLPAHVEIFDISTPNAATWRASYTTPGQVMDMDFLASSSVLVIAHRGGGTGGLILLDVSSPSLPSFLKSVPLTGQPAAIAIDKANLFVAVNNEAGGQCQLEVYDLRNIGAFAQTGLFQQAGTAFDVQAGDNSVILSLSSGSVWKLAFSGVGSVRSTGRLATMPYGFADAAQIPVPEAGSCCIITTTSGTFVGAVLAGYSMLYPEHEMEGSKGVYIITNRPPAPPVKRKLTVSIMPAQAVSGGCTTHPAPGVSLYNNNETAIITAIPATTVGWSFKNWSGDVSGVDPTVNTRMDRDKLAIANFVQPELLMAGGKGRTLRCPTCETCPTLVDTVISIRLCADEDDDWVIVSITFESAGTGDELADLEHATLYYDGQKLSQQTFATDDGRITFPVNRVLAMNDCRTLLVVYTFKTMTTAAPRARSYELHTNTGLVSALPAHHAAGVRTPQPSTIFVGGPVLLGPVINVTHKSVHATIQEAVTNASADDELEVCPGTYRECVNVNTPLTLRAKETPATTLVIGNVTWDNTFDIRTPGVTLRGLTISGGDNGVAVFTNNRRTTGSTTITNCIITNNKHGVAMFDASGMIIDGFTRIHNNAYGGLKFDLSWNIALNDVVVSNNGGTGISFWSAKRIAITRTTVTDNKGKGVSAHESEDFTFSSSVCSRNRGEGVELYGVKGNANRITDCVLERNSFPAINIERSTSVGIERNLIQWNTARDEFHQKSPGAIAIGNGSSGCRVKECRVVSNDADGIRVGTSRQTEISGTSIASNTLSGIAVSDAAALPTIDRCYITRHRSAIDAGIHVLQGDFGTITNTTVKDNADGIALNAADDWTVARSTCTGNIGTGRNQNNGNGLLLHSSSNASIVGNTLSSNMRGILLERSDGIAVLSNTIWWNSLCGMYASESQYTLSGNSIWFNGLPFMKGDGGAVISRASRSAMHGNSVAHNTGDGLLFAAGSTGIVRDNVLEANSSAGLRNVDDLIDIDARGNWWGDASGPGGMGPGTGDEVFGRVTFDPWTHADRWLICAAAKDSIIVSSGDRDSVWLTVFTPRLDADSIAFDVTSSAGWVMTPASLQCRLPDSAGLAFPVSFTVPVGTPNAAVTTITCIARSLLHPGVADTARIVATVRVPLLTAIRAFPDTITVRPGMEVQLSAWGWDERAHPKPVHPIWSTVGGMIDTAMVFTAGSQTGTFEATARDATTGFTARSIIIIDTSAARAASVRVSPSTRLLTPGMTAEFTLLGTDQYGDVRAMSATWTAEGGSIQGGVYTAGTVPGPWHITAHDSATGLEAGATVTIITGSFAQITPPDGATDRPVNLRLAWQPHPLALSYHVQVARDPQFTDLVVNDSLVPFTEWDIEALPHALHHWRVRAVTGDDTLIRTGTWTFSTRMAVPGIITLRAPVDGTHDVPLATTCTWDTHAAFTSYRFTLSRDSSLANPVRVDSGLTIGALSLAGLEHRCAYHWQVEGVMQDGMRVASPVWSFTTRDTTSTGIDGTPPTEFLLFNNHPNPFSASTIISYGLPTEADVLVEIRSLTGALLARYQQQAAPRGIHHVEWNATGVPTGTYLITVHAAPIGGHGLVRRGMLRAVVLH